MLSGVELGFAKPDSVPVVLKGVFLRIPIVERAGYGH